VVMTFEQLCMKNGHTRVHGQIYSLEATYDARVYHPDTQANFTRLASFIALTKSDTIQRVLFSMPAVPFKEPLPAYSPSVLSV
jgi:hypothetical protein